MGVETLAEARCYAARPGCISFCDSDPALELTKASRQERGRNAWHAAVDLIELRAAIDQPAHDEQRPALAQQLDSERERTVLAILMCHGAIVLGVRNCDQYKGQVVAGSRRR